MTSHILHRPKGKGYPASADAVISCAQLSYGPNWPDICKSNKQTQLTAIFAYY